AECARPDHRLARPVDRPAAANQPLACPAARETADVREHERDRDEPCDIEHGEPALALHVEREPHREKVERAVAGKAREHEAPGFTIAKVVGPGAPRAAGRLAGSDAGRPVTKCE